MAGLSGLYDEMTAFFRPLWPGEDKPLVLGEGNENAPELMLIGEAPGETEVIKRRPFVGKAGKNLDEFLQMLRQMPAELAIRIKEAEWAAEGAKNARSDGERDAIEKLKARQALPTPMRTIIPVSAEPDFSTMSSEEFARFKRRRFGQ